MWFVIAFIKRQPEIATHFSVIKVKVIVAINIKSVSAQYIEFVLNL